MGLKYIEPIKSIILLLLVLLSVTFTFSIWTYSPQLPIIEQSPTVDISIGERKKDHDIIKPYKFVIKYDEALRGTTEQTKIDQVLKEMSTWKVSQLVREPNEMNKTEMKAFFEQTNQFTMYFQGDVPLPVYDKILPIEDDIPLPDRFSFDRLVVQWNAKEIAFRVHFISQATGIHYHGRISANDMMTSYRNIVQEGQTLPVYAEVAVEEPVYLAVPAEPVKMSRSTYYQEEISPTRFRDALFNDPNAVRRSQVDATHEEFGDDHARLIVNTNTKMLNFFHPAAEIREPANPSVLLQDVIDSINEHGGWTDSYRYSYMNSYSRYVKFQLFIHGYPVFGEPMGTTEISQIYGENRVFRYNRPYYTRGVLLHDEEIELPSGLEIANALKESEKLDIGAVEEITVGYTMRHDQDQRIFVMEPAWYYLIKGDWSRYVPDQGGGEQIGLE
ncbi:two-component system activity regulator YycH [Sporosarcina sp. ACRSL]|uniref:YycH family regulatory protein n=1 Tax=Sporosarcina sp. ACRSL TaxID=2918215 RepID=UPI001EF69CBD|nr:two-component system activity regulator YycH [Sporosarcina sp. ACRSL]MCG7345809.1 two-component system activity regulator YycH [Sporosarcina sp. ACRSL]